MPWIKLFDNWPDVAHYAAMSIRSNRKRRVRRRNARAFLEDVARKWGLVFTKSIFSKALYKRLIRIFAGGVPDKDPAYWYVDGKLERFDWEAHTGGNVCQHFLVRDPVPDEMDLWVNQPIKDWVPLKETQYNARMFGLEVRDFRLRCILFMPSDSKPGPREMRDMNRAMHELIYLGQRTKQF